MEKQSYDDIIGLARPISKRHPSASMYDRAAQFSAFEALTGHEDAVIETARLTDEKPVLSESARQLLDETLSELINRQDLPGHIYVQYFEKDLKKEGGAILEVVGDLRKIDLYERMLIMEDGLKIAFSDILDLEHYKKEVSD